MLGSKVVIDIWCGCLIGHQISKAQQMQFLNKSDGCLLIVSYFFSVTTLIRREKLDCGVKGLYEGIKA